MTHLPVIILTGPTAVGKTDLSIALAQRLNTEIISSDSRQVYKQLNIGTAKPTPEQLSSIPHHLIDIFDVNESYSAGEFAEDAVQKIRSLLNEGRIPLVVGGSTLYLHALQFGLSDIPRVDKITRERVSSIAKQRGVKYLYNYLEEIDPFGAKRIDSNNSQLIARAVEVYLFSGKPISHFQTAKPPYRDFRICTFVLTRQRSELYDRINTRVDRMITSGLLEEARNLFKEWNSDTSPALRTIGYKEAWLHMQNEISEDEMISLIKRNTRRYAKRQLTWFRRYSTYKWLDATLPRNLLIETIIREAHSPIND